MPIARSHRHAPDGDAARPAAYETRSDEVSGLIRSSTHDKDAAPAEPFAVLGRAEASRAPGAHAHRTSTQARSPARHPGRCRQATTSRPTSRRRWRRPAHTAACRESAPRPPRSSRPRHRPAAQTAPADNTSVTQLRNGVVAVQRRLNERRTADPPVAYDHTPSTATHRWQRADRTVSQTARRVSSPGRHARAFIDVNATDGPAARPPSAAARRATRARTWSWPARAMGASSDRSRRSCARSRYRTPRRAAMW